ncbi:MAG: phosphoheptose isomerase [Candidatus Paceibacterota bacterium]
MQDRTDVLVSPDKNKSPRLKDGFSNIIIDIDGVVCEDIPNEQPERMPSAGEIEGSKEKINEWFNEGHIVTFFTSRTEEHRRVTEKWLKAHGFKFHKVIFGKPRGGNYHYIDDRDIKATKFTGKLNFEIT